MDDKQRLETAIDIETPEGIDLVLTPAGGLVRSLAFLIDFSIRLVVFIILATVLNWMGEVGTGLLSIVIFLLEWFYPVVFEVFGKGATPGKRMMHLRVVQADGTPVRLPSALIRNLLRVVDFLPFGYVAAWFTISLSAQCRRLGDIAADTLVVHEERAALAFDSGSEVQRPFPVALQLPEQQTIVQFSQRAAGLSVARQEELANILTPILEVRDQDAVAALHASANHTMGRVVSR